MEKNRCYFNQANLVQEIEAKNYLLEYPDSANQSLVYENLLLKNQPDNQPDNLSFWNVSEKTNILKLGSSNAIKTETSEPTVHQPKLKFKRLKFHKSQSNIQINCSQQSLAMATIQLQLQQQPFPQDEQGNPNTNHNDNNYYSTSPLLPGKSHKQKNTHNTNSKPSHEIYFPTRFLNQGRELHLCPFPEMPQPSSTISQFYPKTMRQALQVIKPFRVNKFQQQQQSVQLSKSLSTSHNSRSLGKAKSQNHITEAGEDSGNNNNNQNNGQDKDNYQLGSQAMIQWSYNTNFLGNQFVTQAMKKIQDYTIEQQQQMQMQTKSGLNSLTDSIKIAEEKVDVPREINSERCRRQASMGNIQNDALNTYYQQSSTNGQGGGGQGINNNIQAASTMIDFNNDLQNGQCKKKPAKLKGNKQKSNLSPSWKRMHQIKAWNNIMKILDQKPLLKNSFLNPGTQLLSENLKQINEKCSQKPRLQPQHQQQPFPTTITSSTQLQQPILKKTMSDKHSNITKKTKNPSIPANNGQQVSNELGQQDLDSQHKELKVFFEALDKQQNKILQNCRLDSFKIVSHRKVMSIDDKNIKRDGKPFFFKSSIPKKILQQANI